MLMRGDGKIVNITSIDGKVAVPHVLPYTASEFAAVGFSKCLNAELSSKGIRVTTVCPGLCETGSDLHGTFTGDTAREYRWFSLAAGLPGISTSARSAPRKIVRAVISGKSEIAITLQAMLAGRFVNVCPTATMRALRNDEPCSAISRIWISSTFLAEAAARRYKQSGLQPWGTAN
jgi:short-subunit dehydrogenase